MKRILTLLFITATATVFAATPKVQIVHNSADPAADSVNIYVVDTVNNHIDSIINLKFRQATSVISLVSGQGVKVKIAPGGTNYASSIYTQDFGVLPDSNYVIFANGVLNPGSFASNPDAHSTAFNLFVKTGARFQAVDPTKVDLAYFHGVTDAPTIDVKITSPSVATLVNDLSYGGFQDYGAVAPTTYIVKITDASGATVVKSYLAPLSTGQGAAAVVFASGFLNPATNNNGPAFGIYAVLADQSGNGLVFPLQEITTAYVQLIHNAADTNATSVDLYLTDGSFKPIRKFDNFDFRTGTAYIEVPATLPLKLVVAPKTSTSIADSVKSFDMGPYVTGSANVEIINGVINTASYAANPDGHSTALNLYPHSGRILGSDPHKADLMLFHGCTDAPTIDVKTLQPSVATVVDNISYGSYDAPGYLTLDSANYVIQITDSSGMNVVKAYSAPLSLTVGATAVVYASGFLNPTTNSGGPSFTVQVTLPNAITLSLPEYLGVEETPSVTGVKMFPNPANAVTKMNFNLEKNANVKFQLTTLAGETVQSADLGNLSAGSNNIDINVANLANGMYMMSIIVDNHASFTRPVIVQK